MKRTLFALAIIITTVSVRAQVMQQKTVWATISVPQMKCWECKDKLQKALLREGGRGNEGGIFQVIINTSSATVRIQYTPDRFNVDDLRTAIADAGFDADSIKAFDEPYAKLPPACKRKEDGGGPQKGKPCNVPPADYKRR